MFHVKRYIQTCRQFVCSVFAELFCNPIVEFIYHGFWEYRNSVIKRNKIENRPVIYNTYIERHNCFIGLGSRFLSPPILPHGLHGIHISDKALIGENVVILQNVTIGSNTLKGSKKIGAPKIGNNVFIGANACIIGQVIVGNNCRIGANCCVYKDVPDNSTVVMDGLRVIVRNEGCDNRFIGIHDVR